VTLHLRFPKSLVMRVGLFAAGMGVTVMMVPSMMMALVAVLTIAMVHIRRRIGSDGRGLGRRCCG